MVFCIVVFFGSGRVFSGCVFLEGSVGEVWGRVKDRMRREVIVFKMVLLIVFFVRG